jgi:hypothetical protein
MTRKRVIEVLNIVVFVAVVYLILAFIARFSVRQSVVLTLMLTVLAKNLERLTEQKPKFQRIQFRIGLTGFRQSLIDAGIYGEDEVNAQGDSQWESLGPYSSGYITFYWLEHDLFFMPTASHFSERAEVAIDLQPFGSRTQKVGGRLSDCIKLRPCVDANFGGAYELVLIKSESRAGWDSPEGPTVTLIKLPIEFFRALQAPPLTGDSWGTEFKLQREILERSGLKYWQDEEVHSAWDFRGKYADLHWWELGE